MMITSELLPEIWEKFFLPIMSILILEAIISLLAEVIMKQNNIIPIEHKINLTIAEAAQYSNIGINRIEILLKNPVCPFLLLVGKKRLVKRKQFEEFLEECSFIE